MLYQMRLTTDRNGRSGMERAGDVIAVTLREAIALRDSLQAEPIDALPERAVAHPPSENRIRPTLAKPKRRD